MLKIKLNVISKWEKQKNDNCKEVVIKLPKDEEELKKDFEYLGLDYDKISMHDTHVLECEFMDNENSIYAEMLTEEINGIITRASNSGYTTSFQNIKKIYEMIAIMEDIEREKALAILEFKDKEIEHLHDAIKYLKELDKFEYCPEANNIEDFATLKVYKQEVDTRKIIKYIDLNTLGKDLLADRKYKYVFGGLIIQGNDELKEYENDEEFE